MTALGPDIIRKIKTGDMLAFRELVIWSTPYAYSVAFRILNEEDDSKDVVQESMIKIWKKINGFNEVNNYKTWLYRIVVHTCFDFLRKQKRNSLIRPDDHLWEKIGNMLEDSGSNKLDNSDTSAIIRSLTLKLGPLQKAVFVMSELMNLDQDEIADILNINKTAVKANLYHARRGIKKMMAKYM